MGYCPMDVKINLEEGGSGLSYFPPRSIRSLLALLAFSFTPNLPISNTQNPARSGIWFQRRSSYLAGWCPFSLLSNAKPRSWRFWRWSVQDPHSFILFTFPDSWERTNWTRGGELEANSQLETYFPTDTRVSPLWNDLSSLRSLHLIHGHHQLWQGWKVESGRVVPESLCFWLLLEKRKGPLGSWKGDRSQPVQDFGPMKDRAMGELSRPKIESWKEPSRSSCPILSLQKRKVQWLPQSDKAGIQTQVLWCWIQPCFCFTEASQLEPPLLPRSREKERDRGSRFSGTDQALRMAPMGI